MLCRMKSPLAGLSVRQAESHQPVMDMRLIRSRNRLLVQYPSDDRKRRVKYRNAQNDDRDSDAEKRYAFVQPQQRQD